MSGRTFNVLPCFTLTVPVLTPRGLVTYRARVQWTGVVPAFLENFRKARWGGRDSD